MKNFSRCVLIVMLLTAVVATPVNVFSCGPYFPTVVFVRDSAPDGEFKSYVQGRLGIVRNDFYELSLLVAYRYFTGRPLSTNEQDNLCDTSNHERIPETPSPALGRWLDARRTVMGTGLDFEIPVETQFPGEERDSFRFYRNINDEAFRNACSTLENRIAQFGRQNPSVVNWVRAQDNVFYSVDGNHIPPPPEAGTPPLLQADRAYQIASAHFYAREFSVAESLYALIGKDDSSPWKKISRYLVARCMIREATLLSTNQDSVLLKAENYLGKLLADRDMTDMHPAVRLLLNFCLFRTDPSRLWNELDRRLTTRPMGPQFLTEWSDYINLAGKSRKTPAADRSAYSDWKTCYRGSRDSMKFSHAYEEWEKTQSPAWLIAALSKATPTVPELPSLLSATESIPPKALEYATANYWRVRLLIDGSKRAEARRLIDTLLLNKSVSRSISCINLLLAERGRNATNLEELLRSSYAHPYAVYWGDDETDRLTNLNELFTPAATTLNKSLPVTMLDSICRTALLPFDLRASLIRAVWVRACLTGHDSIAVSMNPALARVCPRIRPLLAQFKSASDEDSRRFAASFVMLHFPGLRPWVPIGVDRSTALDTIDDLRDNWWYAGKLAVEASADVNFNASWERRYDRSPDTTGAPSFMTEDQRSAADKETAVLRSLPAAASYFGRITTGWAEKHPRDPRVPEALHLSVRVSRFGCTDSLSRGFSKKAFSLLHIRYPRSDWTAQTKYWF